MSFAFLGIAGRTLGKDAFEPLSVYWALIYLVCPGFFLPLEQEVSRALANRWARGLGVGTLVRQAGQLGAGLTGALVLAVVVAAPFLLDHLFDDQVLIIVALVLAIVGYAAVHLARGDPGRPRSLQGLRQVLRLREHPPRGRLRRAAGCSGSTRPAPTRWPPASARRWRLLLALRSEHDLASEGPDADWAELGPPSARSWRRRS